MQKESDMSEEVNNAKSTPPKKNGGFIKSIISGTLLSEKLILGNLGYIAMLTFIGAIYIGNRFHAEKVIRRTEVLMEEVKELRAESMATSAELMFLSKQSEVSRLVKERGLGLEELKEPPYKLVVKEQ